MKVLQGITIVIITPMHKANTLNVLPVVTSGYTSITVTVILRQALWGLKSPTNKKLGDSMCMSIPRRMFIIPISGEIFHFSKHILNTQLLNDYFSMNISLDNYDGLVDLMKHMQNVCSSLELIIQDHDSMCLV